MELNIQHLNTTELRDIWKEAFNRQGIHRGNDYYDMCLEENLNGIRVTPLAFADGQLAGCLHLKFRSLYPYFRENNIPEINDFNVFPDFRKRGIGNKLMEECERIARKTGRIIGIGVGLFKDYGAAQRIYCRRGYILDGNGVAYNNKTVAPGSMVRVDDDLNLYFTKDLSGFEKGAQS